MYTKLCISSDAFPFDINNFAICSEMIDVFIGEKKNLFKKKKLFIDISCIYG